SPNSVRSVACWRSMPGPCTAPRKGPSQGRTGPKVVDVQDLPVGESGKRSLTGLLAGCRSGPGLASRFQHPEAQAMRYLIVLAILAATLPLRGQDPAKEPKLPAPRPLAFEMVPLTFEMVPIRENRYDVWQNYGVDRYGRFRPIVILPPGPA